jgi:SAM-dependent methyltransferase
MDEHTLSAYDAKAADYCEDWLGQPAPEDIQQLWRRFFTPAGLSADVGSGSGRDVDWLNRNGFPCVGLDASEGLLAQARGRFPQWRFQFARLPELAEVSDAVYHNVVCETVLMHLPVAEVRPAVRALGRILAPEGTLYLSWRVTEGADIRDGAGRLYCAFPAQDVRDELRGFALVYDEEEISQSSGRRVHRLIVRRSVVIA